MKIKIILFTSLISLLAFTFYDPIKLYSTENVIKYLTSTDKDSILIGAYNAQKRKDILFVPLLLQHISDPRISHHKYFYGITVHNGCIIALKEISGKAPPNEITDGVEHENQAYEFIDTRVEEKVVILVEKE